MANIELDLDTIIDEAATDASSPEPADIDSTTSTSADQASEDSTLDATADPDKQAAVDPSKGANEPIVDEFEKKFGIPALTITGRENRVPHSRVKQMVEKTRKETEDRVRKELEGATTPKITEYETKIKDYEERLSRVSQFENIIENDPRQFLDMLSKVPAYKQFFEYIGQLAAAQQGTQPTQQPHLSDAGMPQPDQTLSDGSKVYSMEGLRARDEWLAKQIEERAVTQAETRLSQRYAPMEQAFQAQAQQAKVIPIIQKQIADARTWPQFNENEAAIIAALKADPTLSLDAAYRGVVHPILMTNRDDMRKSILEELKKKPLSTSAPTSPSRPAPPQAGKQSLDDIISGVAESLR